MPKRSIFYDDKEDTTLGGRVFQAREAAGANTVAALDDAGGMAHCSCVNATNQTAVEGPKIRGKSK